MTWERSKSIFLSLSQELKSARPLQSVLKLLYSVLRQSIGLPSKWRPQQILESPNRLHGSVAVTAHIFYPEFVGRLGLIMSNFPEGYFFVSTSSPEIESEIRSLLLEKGVKGRVVLAPNKGRNFGPLLVEFRRDLMEFDFFIHLHSKRSAHSHEVLGKTWADRCWALLGENRSLLIRMFSIFESDDRIALAYPDVSDLLSPANFRFGANRKPALVLAERMSLGNEELALGSLPFPAGGMFFARTAAMQKLLDAEFNYSDFPGESGQKDGTPQHALERLVGYLGAKEPWRHVVYLGYEDCFTIDTGYANGV